MIKTAIKEHHIMSKKKDNLNNEAAPEKKKFMKSVASWFVEEEEDEPVQEYPAEEAYEASDAEVYEAPEAESFEAAEQEYPEEETVPSGYTQPAAAAGGTAAAEALREAPQEAPEGPVTNKNSKKDKKSKGKKKAAQTASDEPAKKKRRIPGFLIFLIIVAIIAAGLYIHIRTDIHDKNTEYRGTVIGDTYCYYNEKKDEIVKYSTSKGPKVVKSTDEDFAKLFEKLNPVDRSAERNEHIDDVAAAFGSGFNAANYKFIDYASRCVLFSYPNNGVPALWLFNEKYNTVEPVVTGANIRGIAFGNFIIYARDDDKDETVCYRVSTSYSGQVLSVDEFRTVSKSPVTFWSSTFWDFVKGLVRGLKASTDSRSK